MAEHSPGPWEASDTGIWAVSPWNARFKLATVTAPSPMNGIDWQANARLIAAAPELLAAVLDAHALILFAMTPRPAHSPGPSPVVVGDVLDKLRAAAVKAGASTADTTSGE